MKEQRVFLQYQPTKEDDKKFFVKKTINVVEPLPGRYISLTETTELIDSETYDIEIELTAANRIL
jgi:hypothetical protein